MREGSTGRVLLLTAATICVVSAAMPAGIHTAWYRFEDGTAGDTIGTLTNSGDSGSLTAVGRAFHTDGTEPKYSDVAGGQVQDGLGGTEYPNTRSDFVGMTTADTGNPHGGGVIDIQGLNLVSYFTNTVEFFYRTPSDISLSRGKRLLKTGGPNFNEVNDYGLEIRQESDDALYVQKTGPDQVVGGYGGAGFMQPDTWYHMAVVMIDSGGDGDLPAEAVGDDDGTPVYYQSGYVYFFINYDLALYGPAGGGQTSTRMWLGGYPPYQSWADPTEGRLDTTTLGYYDEIRLTMGWGGGTHLDAAALHPDGFLRIISPLLPGDANGDGCVDDLDLTALAVNWQQSTSDWDKGDFNGDGIVDDLDLTALAVNWQQGCGGGGSFADALAAANVPDPATALLLAVGSVAVVRRRR